MVDKGSLRVRIMLNFHTFMAQLALHNLLADNKLY
jgi:hypothetical protein